MRSMRFLGYSPKKRKHSPEELAASKRLVEQEREFNGEKCNYELYKHGLQVAKKELCDEVSEIMEPVINYLKTRSGEWKYASFVLAFSCGRLPPGEHNSRIAMEWSVYELNRHENPPEGYLKDLQDAYLEMWLECKKLIDEHRAWFNSIPKVPRPICLKDSPHFWGSVKPFTVIGGYRGTKKQNE